MLPRRTPTLFCAAFAGFGTENPSRQTRIVGSVGFELKIDKRLRKWAEGSNSSLSVPLFKSDYSPEVFEQTHSMQHQDSVSSVKFPVLFRAWIPKKASDSEPAIRLIQVQSGFSWSTVAWTTAVNLCFTLTPSER